MKKMAFIAALLVSASAFGEFRCKIENFGKFFKGSGQSKIEAQINTRIACSKKVSTMFCGLDKTSCREVATDQLNYCEIDVFGKLFYSFSHNVIEASDNVMDSCLESSNAFFCKEDKVKCYTL